MRPMARKKAPKESGETMRDEWKEIVGCMSCGLPMETEASRAATEVGEVCPHCVDKSGHLKSYEEVFERLVTQHFMKTMKMSRPEAEEAARKHLAATRVWGTDEMAP